MSSKSLKNHLKSTKHDTHRIRKDNQETQQRAELQHLNDAYQGASLLNSSVSSVPLASRPGMFSEDGDVFMDCSANNGNSWPDGPLIPISVPEHLTFDPEDERACLHRQYISMLEQAFSVDDVDEEESSETTAYLADEFRALGMWVILEISQYTIQQTLYS